VPRVIPVLLATALASGGCSVILGIDYHALAPGDDSGSDGAGGHGWDVAGGDSSALLDAAADAGGLATTDQTPTKDAYLRDGAYATMNFGLEKVLGVKNAYDGVPGYSRTTWVAFDISHFTSVTAAKLRLFLNSLDTTDTKAVLANVFSSSNDWGETTITWNNAPAKGPQIASNTVDTPSVGTWVEWDVTSAVQTEIGGTSTLVIEGGLGSIRLALFSSREGVHPPVLRITGN
jgi:hypothetical protein